MELSGKEVLEIYAAPKRLLVGAVHEGFGLHIPNKPFEAGYLVALVKDAEKAVQRHGRCIPAESDMLLLLSVCGNKLLNLRQWLAAEYNLSAPDKMTMEDLIECVVQKRPKVKLYADTLDAMTDESGARVTWVMESRKPNTQNKTDDVLIEIDLGKFNDTDSKKLLIDLINNPSGVLYDSAKYGDKQPYRLTDALKSKVRENVPATHKYTDAANAIGKKGNMISVKKGFRLIPAK